MCAHEAMRGIVSLRIPSIPFIMSAVFTVKATVGVDTAVHNVADSADLLSELPKHLLGPNALFGCLPKLL